MACSSEVGKDIVNRGEANPTPLRKAVRTQGAPELGGSGADGVLGVGARAWDAVPLIVTSVQVTGSLAVKFVVLRAIKNGIRTGRCGVAGAHMRPREGKKRDRDCAGTPGTAHMLVTERAYGG